MSIFRRHNDLGTADDVARVVAEQPPPDAYARHRHRRSERVKEMKERYSEKVGTRQYDVDARNAFDGQIDADTGEWYGEDLDVHEEYLVELGVLMGKAEAEVKGAEGSLADANKDVRRWEEEVVDLETQLTGRQRTRDRLHAGGTGGPTVPPTQSKGRDADTDEATSMSRATDANQGRASAASDGTGVRSTGWGRYRDVEEIFRKRSPWWLWALITLAVVGDVAAFYVVLDKLFRSYPVVTAFLVLAGAAISVLLSHWDGKGWRRRVARDPERSDAMLWVALAGWVLLGVALGTVRLFLGGGLSIPVLGDSASQFGSPTAASNTADGLAYLPALVFLALYVGSGLCAMWASYEAYNPVGRAYRSALQELQKAQDEAHRWARAYAAALMHKEPVEKKVARAPKRQERERVGTYNEIVGVKHHVREQMAANTDSIDGLALFMKDAPEPKELPED